MSGHIGKATKVHELDLDLYPLEELYTRRDKIVNLKNSLLSEDET